MSIKRDHELMAAELLNAISELPKKQAIVIIEKYKNDATYKEIGNKLECSYQYVEYMARQALRRLRRPRTSNRFKCYYEQYITPYPIVHVGIESFQRTGYSEVERAVLGFD